MSDSISKDRLNHMIGVASYMRNRANSYSLDNNTMYIIGLLHDIGYLGGAKNHEEYGAKLLESIGVNKVICNIIANHGTRIEDAIDKIEGIEGKKTLLLLYEADMQVDIHGNIVGFQDRLRDIANRHGVSSKAYINSYNNILGLKYYWDKFGIEPISILIGEV